MVKKLFKGIFNYLRTTDLILWFLLAAISVYSLVLLKSVSRAVTESDYFKTQLIAVVVGSAAAIVLSLLDYGVFGNFWYLIAGASILLMIYTLVFGEEVVGSGGVNAKAWINIGGRTFQSSELVKIAFMITYAKHLEILKKNGTLTSPLQVVFLGVHALVPMFLCYLQGDTGAAVVFFFMFLTMSLAGGVQLRYFAILGILLIIAIPLLWRFVMAEYQKDRIIALFNLDNPVIRMDAGYQQYQGRISIGSGKWSGQGLFEGSRVASRSVPFQHSDYIFSVAGEELGFVGCSLIILLLLLFMLKVLHVASTARDDLGRLMCFGFFGMIALQSVSNIGMCLAILPVMGLTLPFFSAGGSSAICLYFGFGLVQSVYMHRKESDGLRVHRSTPLRFSYDQIKTLQQ